MRWIGLHPTANPKPGQSTGPALALISGWLVLIVLALGLPGWTDSPTRIDELTRYPVRVALLFYGVAVVQMMMLDRSDWNGRSAPGRLARLCWTLAWAGYLVHLFTAFHYYHGWSHAHAVAHTEARSGFGPGIYVSHLFTLAWTADVVYWWIRPDRYRARGRWIDRSLHGFMLFVSFNATVVFEEGVIRWAGVGLFAVILVAAASRFAFRARDP